MPREAVPLPQNFFWEKRQTQHTNSVLLDFSGQISFWTVGWFLCSCVLVLVLRNAFQLQSEDSLKHLYSPFMGHCEVENPTGKTIQVLSTQLCLSKKFLSVKRISKQTRLLRKEAKILTCASAGGVCWFGEVCRSGWQNFEVWKITHISECSIAEKKRMLPTEIDCCCHSREEIMCKSQLVSYHCGSLMRWTFRRLQKKKNVSWNLLQKQVFLLQTKSSNKASQPEEKVFQTKGSAFERTDCDGVPVKSWWHSLLGGTHWLLADWGEGPPHCRGPTQVGLGAAWEWGGTHLILERCSAPVPKWEQVQSNPSLPEPAPAMHPCSKLCFYFFAVQKLKQTENISRSMGGFGWKWLGSIWKGRCALRKSDSMPRPSEVRLKKGNWLISKK